MRRLFIKKESGDYEIFSLKKIRNSLAKIGITNQDLKKIVEQIKTDIKPGVSTNQIYQRIFSLLKRNNSMYAAKYSLKKSIMLLGPTGFPFEHYLAAILENIGYTVFTNKLIKGKCLTHEVDVIAEKPKENIHAFIECKFHSHGGSKTAAKDILYTHARFLDINYEWVAKRNRGAKPAGGQLQCWLVTNTQVTVDVKQYGQCAGINVISWNYPAGQNLQNLIESNGLYPLTSLTGLNYDQKRYLLKRGTILCKDLLTNKRILKPLNIRGAQLKALETEINALCG